MTKEHPQVTTERPAPVITEEMRAIADAVIKEVEAKANDPETQERLKDLQAEINRTNPEDATRVIGPGGSRLE